MNVEKFKGTSKQFLLAWNNKWETFDKVALNATATYTNEVRLSMLKAAVMGSKMAKDIDAAELVRISVGDNALTYSQYKAALASRAHTLQSEENATRRATRAANETNRDSTQAGNSTGNSTGGNKNDDKSSDDKPKHKYEMLPKKVWAGMSKEAQEKYKQEQKNKRKSGIEKVDVHVRITRPKPRAEMPKQVRPTRKHQKTSHEK